MQIAIVVAALGRAKDCELDVIAASGFINGMQRLMQITHKVDEPLERLKPVCPGGFFVAQSLLKHLNPVHHAVVMVSQRVLMFVLRTEAVALFGKTGSVFRNVDKVPVVAFVTFFSYGIRPACDRSQRVRAEKKLEVLFSNWRETRCRDV